MNTRVTICALIFSLNIAKRLNEYCGFKLSELCEVESNKEGHVAYVKALRDLFPDLRDPPARPVCVKCTRKCII